MTTPNRGLVPVPAIQPIYSNNQPVNQLLNNCPPNLITNQSKIQDFQKIFVEHWVDSINDLRLLIQEGLINQIGLPVTFTQWIESEINRYVISQANNQPVNQPISTPSVLSLFGRPDLQPRIFRRVTDFDTNGIIYWLGSRNQNPQINQPVHFVNPAVRGSVKVMCSGLMKDSKPITAVTDREVVRCVTSADSKAFIQLEFVDCLVAPTDYSLKHYSSWDTECVRNWRFEGSRDGITWTCLIDHKDDQSIEGIGATHTWHVNLNPSINQYSPPSDFINPSMLNHYYRFFKLQLTGPNSNAHLYLACSGIELYGAVLDVKQHATLCAASQSIIQSNNLMTDVIVSPLINPLANHVISQPIHPSPSPKANGLHSHLDVMPPLEDVEMHDVNHQPAKQPILQSHNQPINQPINQAIARRTEYNHLSDFDENGIIYAICSNNQTRPWSNAADAGFIHITASSVLEDSVPISQSIGRDCVRCVTQSKPHSWICWDLIDRLVEPSAYSLKHYSSWDTEALRSWRFEGSLDGVDWVCLIAHTNDTSLDLKCKTHTWIINNPNPLVNQSISRGFRMFRVFQTGENSNKHYHLACSGFELYGKLKELDGTPFDWSKRQQPIVKELELVHSRPFDENGVIHWLATQGKTAPWRNPHASGVVHVSASSLTDDSQPVDAIVGHAIVRCVTQSMINSWIAIDLLSVQVRPTAYSLRHYSSWDNEALRNWRFEGSVHGTPINQSTNSSAAQPEWVLIHNHRNDVSLEEKGATFTWYVKSNQFFRAFRIVQYDENSNKHHYLACSGFEVYGTMRPYTSSQATNPSINQINQIDQSFSSLPSYSEIHGIVPMVLSADQPINPVIQPAVNPLINPSLDLFNNSSLPSANRVQPTIPAAAPSAIPPPHIRANSMVVNPSVNQPFVPAVAPSINQTTHQSLTDPTYHWDPELHSIFFTVNPATPWLAQNGNSSDKWQMVSSRAVFPSSNDQSISRIGVSIVSDAATTNTWKFIIGVIPVAVDCRTSKQWVGTAGSWGYIAGTGGKCHGQALSAPYGEPYGQNDVIGIVMNFKAKTLEFTKNDKSLGIAFNDLQGPVRVAVSATAKDAQVQLVPFPGHQQSLPPNIPRAMSLPPSTQVPMLSAVSHWDETHKGEFLSVDPLNRALVSNIGSKDKWQGIRSCHSFTRHAGSDSFDVEIVQTGISPNQWQFIIGCACPTFTCMGNRQWVGIAGSWGYIGGTGGKCSDGNPKSFAYAAPYGQIGDIVTVVIHWGQGKIEFKKNGISQGIAFDKLPEDVTTLYAAVSLTAKDSKVKLSVPM